MVLQAPAKINLSLDIVGKREDGYHNVEMIMETVSLYDTVTIYKRKGIEVKCNLPYVPTDERNIAFKAAKLFFEESGIEGGAYVNIVKRIPVAAGLAGGSTDGAAVLKGLNMLYGNVFSAEKLHETASRIGADVPYCINGRLALAQGIGEVLTPLGKCPRMNVLLAKPDVSLSTKTVYSMFNIEDVERHPDTKGIISDLEKGEIDFLGEKMFNVLEKVSAAKYPIISVIKEKMRDCGAVSAMMSGSGPTVFGIFGEEEKAKKCMAELQKMCKFVYLAHTL